MKINNEKGNKSFGFQIKIMPDIKINTRKMKIYTK